MTPIRFRPGNVFCRGRDALREQVVRSSRITNAVLLFGGRQSGKTTLLLEIRNHLRSERADGTTYCRRTIPVYVDLQRLVPMTGPPGFYDLLARMADEACSGQIDGYVPIWSGDGPRPGDVDAFRNAIRTIRNNCGEVDARFLFLLDEAKRILGNEFPHGFLDNLFSLLFGEADTEDDCVAFVFAGAQHLYGLLEDSTSPIGSRAASHILPNLDASAVIEVVQDALGSGTAEVARWLGEELLQWTGGQAGLTVRLVQELCLDGFSADDPSASVVRACEEILSTGRFLFENWAANLTLEGRTLVEAWKLRGRLPRRSVPGILGGRGLNSLRADRVCEEMQYMGFASLAEDQMIPANRLFARFMEFTLDDASTEKRTYSPTEDVWKLIERTELALRDLIDKTFAAGHGIHMENQLRRALGPGYDQAEKTQQKSRKQYPLSHAPERDILSCLYIGQLKDVIVCSANWSMFRHVFRGKEEFSLLVGAITPVRNDRAHFCGVPDKELDRCRIACDDLLVILEKEIDRYEQGVKPEQP